MTSRRDLIKASVAASAMSIITSHSTTGFARDKNPGYVEDKPGQNKKLVDHFMWAAVDLDTATAEFEKLTGVRPEFGGRHQGFGTHNALVSLGNGTYMEVLALDPEQSADNPIVREIREMNSPEILAYHLQRSDLENTVQVLQGLGIPYTGPLDLGRKRPDGSELNWRLLFPESPVFKHALPIFIDWMDAPHPSKSAPGGCILTHFEVGHARDDELREIYQALGVTVKVVKSEQAYVRAILDSPKGEVSLQGRL